MSLASRPWTMRPQPRVRRDRGTADRRTRRPRRRPVDAACAGRSSGSSRKLLIMLLATSIISCVVVGVVGYRSGRDALREKAFEQLTFVRNSRARGITREYNRPSV